ncbi:MAG: hypothetical protein AAGA56_17820 [Myxococcota bacterium]
MKHSPRQPSLPFARPHRWTISASVLATALVAVGCGDDDPDAPSSSEGATTATASTTATADDAADPTTCADDTMNVVQCALCCATELPDANVAQIQITTDTCACRGGPCGDACADDCASGAEQLSSPCAACLNENADDPCQSEADDRCRADETCAPIAACQANCG